jgi:HlyD family type I secretion membrane fusion protein
MLALQSKPHKHSNEAGAPVLVFESATAEIIARHHPWLERSVLYTLVTMIALIVAFISFKKLDRIVQATGRLVPISGTLTVQPLEKAIITRVLVRVGDVVKKDQVLATCDPTFAQADLVGLQQKVASLVAQEKRIEAEEAQKALILKGAKPYDVLQTSIEKQREVEYNSGVNDFDQRISSTEALMLGYEQNVTDYKSRLKIAGEEESMYTTLEKENVTSHLQVITIQDQRVEIERLLATAQNNYDSTKHLLESLKEQRKVFVDKWHDDDLSNLVDVKNQLDSARDDLAKAERMSQLVNLVAPADAIVLKIPDLSQGGVAMDAEPLFSLVALNAPMEVEAEIDAKDSGFVRVGDLARIKFDAYQFLEHGVAEGVVKTISEDSFTQEETQDAITKSTYSTGSANTRSPYFETRIALTALKLHDVPSNMRLTPGMTLQTDIVVGHRTILWYLLGGALRNGAEGMREP